MLCSVVSSQDRLKTEESVANEGFDIVHLWQVVKFKFAAYPFQKYGTGLVKVKYISDGAQSEEDARDKGGGC
jgi:HlyD family secretion protein